MYLGTVEDLFSRRITKTRGLPTDQSGFAARNITNKRGGSGKQP